MTLIPNRLNHSQPHELSPDLSRPYPPTAANPYRDDRRQLRQALHGRSRSSVFRDLKPLQMITSYSHTGRYHALQAPRASTHTACGSSTTSALPATGR